MASMTIMNNSGLNAEPCNLVVKIGIQMVVLEYKETNFFVQGGKTTKHDDQTYHK